MKTANKDIRINPDRVIMLGKIEVRMGFQVSGDPDGIIIAVVGTTNLEYMLTLDSGVAEDNIVPFIDNCSGRISGS